MKRGGFSLIFFIILIIINGGLSASTKAENSRSGHKRYGDETFRYKAANLIVESETDDYTEFSGIHALAVDSRGFIYILDFKGGGPGSGGVVSGSDSGVKGPACRILKYDSSGKFVTLIGRVGRGPGEFVFPLQLFVDGEDNLFVRDLGMIIAYDKEGRFIRNIPFVFPSDMIMSDFCVIGKEVVVALTSELGPSGKTRICLLAHPESRLEKRLDSYRDQDFRVRTFTKGGYGGALERHQYSKTSFLRGFPESAVCYGTTDEIKFRIYDKGGNIIGFFKRLENALPLTRSEKRKLQKGKQVETALPDVKPLFASFFVDDKKRFYILRQKEVVKGATTFDVEAFSPEGQFLGRGDPLPAIPQCFRNGAFYVVTYDGDDRHIVRKYEIEGLEYPKK